MDNLRHLRCRMLRAEGDYYCKPCNYTTKDKPNFSKHCKTPKHLKLSDKQEKEQTVLYTELQNKVNNLEQENIELKQDMQVMQNAVDYFINRFISIHILLKGKLSINLVDNKDPDLANEYREILIKFLQK